MNTIFVRLGEMRDSWFILGWKRLVEALDLLEISAVAGRDRVDAIASPLSQGGKFVLDRLGAVAIPAEVGQEYLAP